METSFRVAVSGSSFARGVEHEELVAEHLQAVFDVHGPFVEFRHGGRRGIDQMGEHIALLFGWDVFIYDIDWKKHGQSAESIRDEEMLDTVDLLLAFPASVGAKRILTTLKVAIQKKVNVEIYPL